MTDEQTKVVRLGDRIIVKYATILAEVQGTSIVARGRDQAGFGVIDHFGAGTFVHVGGSWSGEAWALLAKTAGASDPWTELYARTTERWRRVRKHGFLEGFLSIEPWVNGSFLAARTSLQYPEMHFDVLGSGAPPPPRPSPCTQKTGVSPKTPRIAAETFRALPSGHVFVAGGECEKDALAVERWLPGRSDGSVDLLPPVDPVGAEYGTPTARLAVASEREAYVIADRGWAKAKEGEPPYLVKFDGRTWTRLDVPGDHGLRSVSAHPEAGVWVVNYAGALLRRDPAGTWSRVPLPAEAPLAEEVWVLDGKDVWVRAKPPKTASGSTEWERRLLRTVAHPAVFEPDRWTIQSELPPPPASRNCMSVFVHLANLDGRRTAEDWIALLGLAFRGREELVEQFFLAEVEENGRRYLGAIVMNTLGMEIVGDRVAKAIRAKLPAMRPKVWCRHPRLLRMWKVDHETGICKARPAKYDG
ncbi:MAG: hypothetical protein JRI55_38605 [Deltaproteobacteria bacterium]|nr:hypothetical protein [Deltaproteobacteria bacterium]